MLTRVEARNAADEILSLPLDDISEGFVVEEIEGLDPVKATLSSSSFANLDGAQFQSSHREPRNIKLTVGLEPDYVNTSVRDLRDRLYKFFMPKSEVRLRFYMGEEFAVEIEGRVETCETTLFAKEPSVDISVMCFDPDFVALEPVQIVGNTVSDATETLVDYEGTTETGFVFVLNVDRSLSSFSILSRGLDGQERNLDFSAPLAAGDILTISTVVGSKSVMLNRESTLTSMLYAMSSQSNWIRFTQGANHIRVYAEGASIPYTIDYLPRYGGL